MIEETLRDIEKQAWEDFEKWVDQFRADHSAHEDTDIYELALMYPDK